jgi:hypothetical protein
LDTFLAHLPHTLLAIAVVALFVRLEMGERRLEAALATAGDDDVESAKRTARPMSARSAAGMVIGSLLAGAVVVMSATAFNDEQPSPIVVVDYLIALPLAALWAGWGAPRRLAPRMRERIGPAGRAAVRLAVAVVVLGGGLWAGMVLAHGVILPRA